jgi:uncharacterized protein
MYGTIRYMSDWLETISKAEGFDWDRGNSTKNASKHGVSAVEAESVFANRPLLLLDDVAHSTTEIRAKAMGITNTGRQLIVSFTVRNVLIRIVSARPMNRKERAIYEKASD